MNENNLTQNEIEQILTIILCNHKITSAHLNLTFPLKKIKLIKDEIRNNVTKNFFKSDLKAAKFIEDWILFYINNKELFYNEIDDTIRFVHNMDWEKFEKKYDKLINLTYNQK